MRTNTELPTLGRPSQSVHAAPSAVQPEGPSHLSTPAAAMQNTSRPTSSAAARAPTRNIPSSEMNGHHTLTVIRTASNGATPNRPTLSRAKSDIGPRAPEPSDSADEVASTDGNFKIRHGWDDQLNSEEYNNLLTSSFFMYYTDKKHETGGMPKDEQNTYPLQEWRMRDRLKTVSAVLALCLNVGVDPPDVIKTNPCAKEECWIDPTISTQAPGNTPLNQIGKALQTQYEQLSMRTRYKLCLDPTTDETRKFCSTLRRNARNERVLFHYNGHGVPKPTSSGEIWVFNRNYTQYIPLSLYDLQSWIGAPSLFVYDCSDAGLIISNFNKFAEKHKSEFDEAHTRDTNVDYVDFGDCIHLAACREKESLPTNPELPADVFTSCLTDPITMAVRFFILQNPLPSSIGIRDAHNIPGKVSERRTPIGELNWIFTAITDTIAWNSLSKPLFKKLFRQDLMVAALFRNFLLAQRVMRVYHCHPVCHPEIPQTHDHPLWRSWDLAVELILAQLPDLHAEARGEKEYQYKHSEFFSEQLTAFEVYLTQGAVEQKIPEQLPIVLQVLLSQVHRLRALILLSKFLDLGPWAVNLALSIGIFPYVLKLLQSQAIELKPVMVFIWARILAVDQSCQADLLKDNGYQYFINILNPSSGIPILNASEHRAMCAFIVAMFCKDYHQGQRASLSPELIESCLDHLKDVQNPLLRQWSCLCLSKLWVNFPEAKWVGIRCMAHTRLCELVYDPVAEVRASMLYALTAFLGIPDVTAQVAGIEEVIASMVLVMAADGNTMVRREVVIFFSTFIRRYKARFVVAAFDNVNEEANATSKDKKQNGTKSRATNVVNGDSDAPSSTCSHNTIYQAIWKEMLIMSADPHPEIARDSGVVVDYILSALLESPLAKFVQPQFDKLARRKNQQSGNHQRRDEAAPTPRATTPPTPSKSEGGVLSLFGGMRRTTSVAASLKNLWVVQEPSPTPPGSPGRLPRTTDVRAQSRDGSHHRPKTPESKRSPREEPKPRGFIPRDLSVPPELPLVSRFYEWSVEYFREPQMKPTEADEPGSTDYNGRLWRRNRNDKIIAETQPQKDFAGSHRWDYARGYFENSTQPMEMCFHQFEDHLIVTDDRDTVKVWDWQQGRSLNHFSNGNPAGSKISKVRLINEDDQALLMTGTSDGVIKLFRHYESREKTEMVSAFRALTDLVPSNKNAGLVFDWQQGRGLILVAGDVKVIRVWNAGTEICTQDIPARSGSCITSLTSDQVEGDVFIAGFGDGAVRVYDQREKPATAMVKVWKEHRHWVTNVHLQRGGQRELVSGCRSGEVKLWDIRMDKSVKTIHATQDTLRTLSVHEHAPVFAVGTEKHTVKVFNLNTGNHLSSVEPYGGFLNHKRSAPMSATAFHPHRMMIAGAALNDTYVNIFSCHDPKQQTVKTWDM